jgi:hypothetical protein
MSEVHRYTVVQMLSEAGGRISYDPHGPEVVTAQAYDELRAENAGLQTGYKAYEQVNAELMAEVEGLRKDAGRWRAFINCARIKFFGWAGYEDKDPYGNSPGNYRHFAGEFWTMHAAPTTDKEKAAEIMNGFADAAVAAMGQGEQS